MNRLFSVVCRYASAGALAVEGDEAFGPAKECLVGAQDEECAKAIVMDKLCYHVDDQVIFVRVWEHDLNKFFTVRC